MATDELVADCASGAFGLWWLYAVNGALPDPGKETPCGAFLIPSCFASSVQVRGADRPAHPRAARAIEAAEFPDLDGFARVSPDRCSWQAGLASDPHQHPHPWSR